MTPSCRCWSLAPSRCFAPVLRRPAAALGARAASGGLLLEKLLSDRAGEKGERDPLVALGLLLLIGEDDLAEIQEGYRQLGGELRHAVRSNLTVLSLLEPVAGMPDPTAASAAHRLSARTARADCRGRVMTITLEQSRPTGPRTLGPAGLGVPAAPSGQGVWFELRRLLDGTARVYAVAEQDAARLLSEGCQPHPLGARGSPPPRLVLVVAGERLAQLGSARELPVRLGSAAARRAALGLVPFE